MDAFFKLKTSPPNVPGESANGAINPIGNPSFMKLSNIPEPSFCHQGQS